MNYFCKLDLDNLRYTEVYELENGQKRVDLREWGRGHRVSNEEGLDIIKSFELPWT